MLYGELEECEIEYYERLAVSIILDRLRDGEERARVFWLQNRDETGHSGG